LQHLLRSPQRDRLLVLGTYRQAEVEAGAPLAEALADLRREQPFERIVLEGLVAEELADLIRGMTGTPGAESFVQAIHDETEGNPFFAEEVLRHLAETGSLEQRMATGSLGAAGVPEGVKDIVGRRLAALGENAAHVLAIASVVGRRFGLDVLERLSGLDEEELIGALEDALRADLITDAAGEPGRFSFKHALVRETAYDALSRTRRLRLHRRVGEALEELHRADPAPPLGELAHHFVAAAEPGAAEDAVRYATAAGDHAMGQLAYEAAFGHYAAALGTLALIDGATDDQRCDVLLALGDAEARGGEGENAREHFVEAADLAERLGSAERLGQAALGYGADMLGGLWWLSVGVEDKRWVDLQERALALLPPDGALRARVLAQRAMQLYWTSERERCVGMSAEAVAMARDADDDMTLLYTLAAHHAAIWGADAVMDQLAVADEIAALAERSGDRERGLVGLGWRLTDMLALGRRAAVDELVETCAAWAEELRQPAYRWYTTHCLAMLAMLDGRFAEAEDLIGEALALNPQVHEQGASQSWAIQMFALRAEQGRLEELQPVMAAAVEHYPAVLGWRSALAWIYAETGEEARCRAEFERLAADRFGVVPRDGNWLTTVACCTRACASLGDADRAATLYEQLHPYGALNVTTGLGISCLGSVEFYLALLATTAQRWEEAEEHYARARAMHASLRSPPWGAHTDHQHARMLLARGRPEDHARANELLTSAGETADALGMTRLSARVRAARPEADAIP
jgi:tetratricopeptide (TPR) repeat protein